MLRTPWHVEQTWGSNQAVLKGVLETAHVDTAIECGCGNYSTPLLRAYVRQLVTIEHDTRWAERVQDDYPPSPRHSWLLRPLIGVKNPTPASELSVGTVAGIDSMYAIISQGLPSYDLLFVDTYRAARCAAIRNLLPKAQMLVLHDVEESSYEYYQFQEIMPLLEDWHAYEHRPTGKKVNGHIIPWTALYTRTPFDLDSANAFVRQESQRLWGLDAVLEEVQ